MNILTGDYFYQHDKRSLIHPINRFFTPFAKGIPNHGGFFTDPEHVYHATPPKSKVEYWRISDMASGIVKGTTRVEVYRFDDYDLCRIRVAIEKTRLRWPAGTPYDLLRRDCFQLQRALWQYYMEKDLPLFAWNRRHLVQSISTPIVIGARIYRAPGMHKVGEIAWFENEFVLR